MSATLAPAFLFSSTMNPGRGGFLASHSRRRSESAWVGSSTLRAVMSHEVV